MKYALLVHHSQEAFNRRNDATAMAGGERRVEEASRFLSSLPSTPHQRHYGKDRKSAGSFIGGAGLEAPQTATTVSVRDGKRQIHDSPYAETKEYLAGFGIIDVPDLDAVLEWTARHPAASFASIEVRPLLGSHFVTGSPKAS